MLKVHIAPNPEQIKSDNGIGQVVHAQYQYLPALGIELVEHPDRADVVAAHIEQGNLPRVDVLHCHGLYWSGDTGKTRYSNWHHEANKRIVDAARKAYAITVPSEWVAEPFRRDMRLRPVVIGHGIDIGLWHPAERYGYTLWNKNRATDVCDPTPAFELAQREVSIISTFGPTHAATIPEKMRVIGAVDHDQMKELIQHASVYLATTKETFGIGTLEALAAGVPVLGYRWGSTVQLVKHLQTGYLAAPNSIDDLYTGWQWIMEHQTELSHAARESAKDYSWQQVMKQYADLYHRVADEKKHAARGVSIVITCHNYVDYVGEAIESCLNQTRPPEEIIVVDDGSTDDSATLIQMYAEEHPQITPIIQKNQGVAAARNIGIQKATQPYVMCLDADDKIDPRYVEACHQTLEADRSIGVAYTGLALVRHDGTIAPNEWPPQFNWESQAKVSNPPSNCIPCAAMFRKTMWERAGGYKQVYAPGEDTEFWTRGLSLGFHAKRVTNEKLFLYRPHSGSASRTKTYKAIDTWHPWMRDKQYPMAAPAPEQPLVRSYSEPTVSIVIPVGPGHIKHLPMALESLIGQTFRNWEVIVVNDGDPKASFAEMQSVLQPYPFVRVVNTAGREGPARARNTGLQVVRSPLVMFLDADDYLMPTALEKMLHTYLGTGGKYVYIDWYVQDGDQMTHFKAEEYDQKMWITDGKHVISALIPTADVRGIKGFDEKLPGFEDWDFYIRLSLSGICGVRLPEPLLVYRQQTGTIRNASMEMKDTFVDFLRDRYGPFLTGGADMPGCCGGNAQALIAAKEALNGPSPQRVAPPEPIAARTGSIQPPAVVRMEFIGEQKGAISYVGRPSGQTYRGGNNAFDKYIDADPRDVEHLESLGVWRLVSGLDSTRATPSDVQLSADDMMVFAAGL